MLKIDQLRHRQEQRLVPVLRSWDEAKKHLENAIALAEAREREFREISEDVRRKLDALDVVIGMASEADEMLPERQLKAEEKRPAPMLVEKPHAEISAPEAAETSVQVQSAAGIDGSGGLLHKSSRPLFSPLQRRSFSRLSILQ